MFEPLRGSIHSDNDVVVRSVLGPYPHGFIIRAGARNRGPLMMEARAWCEDRLGPIGDAWKASSGMIVMRDPDVAFEFKMRWC